MTRSERHHQHEDKVYGVRQASAEEMQWFPCTGETVHIYAEGETDVARIIGTSVQLQWYSSYIAF
jgi:hypothetical protein